MSIESKRITVMPEQLKMKQSSNNSPIMNNRFWNKTATTPPTVVATPLTPGSTDADFDAVKFKPAVLTSVSTDPAIRRAMKPGSDNGFALGPNADIRAVQDAVEQNSAWVMPLRQQMAHVIVGQQALVDRLLVGLLTKGHLLIEGVPGLAKTLALKTLSSSVNASFHRIQFTPDMLPADIVGTMIYNPRDGSFHTKHGPVFANLILADEINRAPAKVQSALLEAMQERQVTLGEETHRLPDPFMVMATQNPIEQEGTYPLPEAQVDRFMLKVMVNYPNRTEERAILEAMGTSEPDLTVQPVVSTDDIAKARHVVNRIYIDDKVKDYIVDLVLATRNPQPYGIDLNGYVQCGASPRATIYLTLASRTWAFLQGRGYVTPQDVKDISLDVLRHRVTVSYEAEAENITSEHIVGKIIEELPVP